MTELDKAINYLTGHPRALRDSAPRLARWVKEPKLCEAVWRDAKKAVRGMGRPMRSLDYAKQFLEQHPEVHRLSYADIAASCKERRIEVKTWARAKKEMHIPPVPRFGDRKKKPPTPTEPAPIQVSYEINNFEGSVTVSTPEGEDRFPDLQQSTIDFLKWVLRRKQYSKLYLPNGVRYSR